MKLSQDAALKALQVTIQLRNTDPKLYKRTEEVQLHLKNIQIERDTYSGSTLGPRSNALDAEIALLKAQIALMKDGVPSDAAEDYVRKKRQADEATVLRAELKTQIDALEVKIDATDDAIKAKEKEIATAEKQSGLDGLPPLFTWPVNGTITAGYHDPDYQTVFGVPHQAIDIAVPQSTPVRTVSEGIVFTVRDGGATGYNYILVGHSNGYASLYGHVSKSFVKAGDIVTFGQIIALSGGQPHSHGAGPMTTGSHLHLEMMKDGVHFNPLTILP
jgi:murein DD-endopeptidase MepM/ murein hydrolase activator NlpD